MKVVAQSTVPSKPSYMHLGYLAAASSRPLFGLGIVIFILGILFLFRFKNTPKRVEVIYRKPLFWPILGMILIIAGLGIVFFGPMRASVLIRAKKSETIARMKSLDALITERLEAGQGMPDNLDVLLAENELPKEYQLDGWKQPIRLEKTQADDKIEYLLRSAGDDEEYGTDDDWTYPRGKNEEGGALP